MSQDPINNQAQQENNFEITNTNHHFNDVLASQIGVLEAIMVNHFIHWITINQRNKRNFHDNRTWSYQTLDEISSYFIYLSKKQVERILNKLVNDYKILKKGNYNKSKFDRTVWYAFENEGLFIKESGNQMHFPKSGNGNPEIGTPIPDNKTYNKKESISKDIPKKAEPCGSLGSKEPHPLCKKLFEKLKQKRPDRKPPDWVNWNKEIDLMIRTDKRIHENISKMIDWLFDSENMFVVESIKSLRNKYDKIADHMVNRNKNIFIRNVESTKNATNQNAKIYNIGKKVFERRLLSELEKLAIAEGLKNNEKFAEDMYNNALESEKKEIKKYVAEQV